MVKRHAATFLELATDLLVSGYAVRFAAEGTSMFPTIHNGDTIVVAPVDPARIVTGDIVLYRQVDRPIVHRVAEVRRTPDAAPVVVLRGDGKTDCDAAVELRHVLGKVVSMAARPEREVPGRRGCKSWGSLTTASRHVARRIVTFLSY